MFKLGKKSLRSSKDQDLDFSEFEDFDFDSLDQETDDRNVTLASKLKSTLKDELAYKRQDAKFQRDILKQALPEDYTPVLESYDTVSNEVGKLWRDQQKEWEKVRKDVKAVIRPFGDVASKLGFKKLKDWAESPEESHGADINQEQLDTLQIQAILDETFGQFSQQLTQQATIQKEVDDEKYKVEQLDREMVAERQTQGNEILDSINKGIAAQRTFTEQVTYAYQRKSIEFQARQLITQQRTLQMFGAYRQESMKELQSIHKNTGLPDYLKINMSEIAQQALASKVMNGIMSPFDGVGSKLMSRAMGKIRSKMSDLWSFAGEGLSMLNDANQDAADMGGSAGGMYGNMLRSSIVGGVVDKGARKVAGYITPKIRAEMERRGLDVYGSNLSALAAQFPALANSGLKRGFGNNILDGLVNFFGLQDAAITGNRTAYDSRNMDMDKAAFLDNRMRAAVVDIIPGWLKKIYANTYKQAYGENATDLTWDYRSGGFVETSVLNNENMDRIVTASNVKASVEAVNTWMRTLDPHQVMSEKTVKWVRKWVLKERASSDTMHPLDLLSAPAPSDIKNELLFVIPALLGLSEEDKQAIMDSGTVSDLMRMSMRGNKQYNNTMRKLSDAGVKVRSTSTLDEKEIERQAKTAEGRQFLINAGIIIASPDGNSYFINPDFEQKAFNLYGSNYKRNGRIGFEDGKTVVNVIDDNYDPENEKLRLTGRMNYGSIGRASGADRFKTIRKLHSGNLAFDDLSVGDDYIRLPNGDIVSSDDSRFERLKAAQNKGKFNQGSFTGFDYLKPLDARRLRNQALSSLITGKRSFASGGELGKGKQPDEELNITAHGGEFIVSKDATDFNKRVLESINKIGAPLINSDNTINSAYYKLFGFKSEKEFNAGAKLKGLTSKAGNYINEQKEQSIQKIWDNIDIRAGKVSREDINSVLNKRLSVDKRLANVMKLWTKQQQAEAKANPTGYAKGLGKMGINSIGKQLTKLIDPNNEGTNVEIAKQLGNIGKKVGSDVIEVGKKGTSAISSVTKGFANNVRGDMLDRSRTLHAVSGSLKEAENPKMFNQPIDLYFKGKGSPFMTKLGFKNGEYVDQSSGMIIKNPSEITGTVVDREGSVIATLADLATNDVVTRAGKPYRLLGMDDANRRYQSGTEYAASKYSIVAQSEKFQDLLEKGRQAKAKFLLDKPIDIYSRDKTLLLTAQGLKEGRYVDQATGNVLWTHHDITGAVVDTQDNGNIVLTESQLSDGIFDNEGNHIKISKIKQYRNMAFKRTAEVYKQYASKHVNKVRDKALNMMSAMGEKRVGLNYDSNPIDIYVTGEQEPRISAVDFKSGRVLCGGKPIKSHSGISGPVMVMVGGTITQKLSSDELNTLVDAMGNKLQLPLMMSATQRFGSYLKEAALPSKQIGAISNFLRMSKDKRKEVMDEKMVKMGVAFDVYVKGNPITPVLTKKGFENKQYLSMTTGKAIVVPEYIDGPIIDVSGQVLLTASDLEKGLVDFDGKKVNIGYDPINGGLFNNLKGGFNVSRRMAREALKKNVTEIEDVHLKGEKEPLLKAIDIKNGKYFRADNGKPVKEYSDILAGVKDANGNTVVSKDDLKRGLVTASGKNIATLSKLRGSLKGLTNLFRAGSWQSQRDNKKEEKDKNGKVIEKKEKKDSWIGRLIKGFMGPLGLMLTGVVGGIKTVFNKAIGWLGKTLIAKTAGSALGGLLGGLGGGAGRKGAGLLSKLGWRSKLAAGALAGYGAYKGYQYLDGGNGIDDELNVPDNTRNSAYGNDYLTGQQNLVNGELPAGDVPTDQNGNPIWNAVKEWGPEAAMTAAMFYGPIKSAKLLGRGAVAGTKMFGRGVDAIAKGGLKGAGRVASKLVGKLPGVGRLAMGTGKLAGRVGLTTLASTGGLMNIGKTLFTGARLLTPWGLGLTAAYFAGKGLMKLWNNHKNPWNRFRLAQYGFNHNDKATMEKIAGIETAAQSLISIGGNGVTMKNDEKAMNEILRICGFKDDQGNDVEEAQERLPNFAIWFRERFMRVFASYAETLKKIKGKPDIIDLQTLDRNEQEELLKGVHFLSPQNSPYVIMQSPFEKPGSCDMDFADVDKVAKKLRNKIGQLPIPPKKANKQNADDGLDKQNLPTKKEDGTDDELAKSINAEDIVRETKGSVGESKDMVDEANRAAKITAATNQSLAKLHTDAMVETTEAAAKKTDGIFDRIWSSFSDRIKNFQSAAKTAMSKLTSGNLSDTVDGIGDVAGMAGNALGLGGLFKVGQAAMANISALTGGSSDAETSLMKAAMENGITNPTELAMFMAQTAHESGNFKYPKELGNDAYFAKYNNRKDLGNGPNDGARYKGRGWIQLTGRANYAAFSKFAGQDFVANPELVEKEPWRSLATVWFWTQHSNMKTKGRAAAQQGNIKEVTRRVNGGYNGLADREKYFKKYSAMIGNDPAAAIAKKGGEPVSSGNGKPSGASNAVATPKSGVALLSHGQGATTKQANGIVNNALGNLNKTTGGNSTTGGLTPSNSGATVSGEKGVNLTQVTGSSIGLSVLNANNKMGGGKPQWDIDKYCEAVTKRALPKSAGKCAEYVRKALQAGDLDKQIPGGLGNAKDFVNTLPPIGFAHIGDINSVKPQKGDICVFPVYGSNIKGGAKYGHVCIFNGNQWVSDFVQKTMFPNSSNQTLKHLIFRPKRGISKSGPVTATPVSMPTASTNNGTMTTPSRSYSLPGAVRKDGVPINQSVSSSMASINDGSMSTTTTNNQTYTNPQPNADDTTVNQTNVILNKQLVVQEKMLAVLEKIAGSSSDLVKASQNGSTQSSGVQGVQTPDLSKAVGNNSGVAAPSIFNGIKTPLSVKKPV